jgi:transcriptional regulator with XRE-family HTH domain
MTLELYRDEAIDMEGFAERLRNARSSRDLTQTRLAEILEISPRVYNRWERGSAIPKLDTVVKIAEILEVSIDELVGLKKTSDNEPRLRNHELHRLYREIDRLSDEDQQALVVVLDSLVKRSQLKKVMAV